MSVNKISISSSDATSLSGKFSCLLFVLSDQSLTSTVFDSYVIISFMLQCKTYPNSLPSAITQIPYLRLLQLYMYSIFNDRSGKDFS